MFVLLCNHLQHLFLECSRLPRRKLCPHYTLPFPPPLASSLLCSDARLEIRLLQKPSHKWNPTASGPVTGLSSEPHVIHGHSQGSRCRDLPPLEGCGVFPVRTDPTHLFSCGWWLLCLSSCESRCQEHRSPTVGSHPCF